MSSLDILSTKYIGAKWNLDTQDDDSDLRNQPARTGIWPEYSFYKITGIPGNRSFPCLTDRSV